MQGIHTQLIWHGLHHPRVYFQAALEAYCLRRADLVTVESEWGKKKIQVFRQGRPIELVEYGVHPMFFKTKWKPVARPKTFLFVGTVCPQKGIEDCLAAFRDPRLRGLRLEVYGSGSARYIKKLKKKSSPNVEWRGRQTPEVLVKAYEKASALILPTRADTSPNVVKEARVVGLPVITSAEGGQTAYVINKRNGFIIKNKNVEDLSQVLMSLAQNQKTILRMGKDGAILYRNNLHPQLTANNFLKLYKRPIKHKTPSI